MTQTKQVITKRMAQKENVAITGTGGRVEKAEQSSAPASVAEMTEPTIPTPKASRKSGKRK